MSTRHLHLARRGAVYYWRARLPQTLRDALGRTSLVVSLRTKEAAPARRRARSISAAIDRLEALLVNAPSKFPPSMPRLSAPTTPPPVSPGMPKRLGIAISQPMKSGGYPPRSMLIRTGAPPMRCG